MSIAPVVCLPSDADRWSTERLRIVMIHELSHIERFDALTEFMAQLALVIFWFNPLLWLAVRRMRTEREHACDDRVLTHGVKASTYVEELVMMMKSIGRGAIAPGFGAIAMARRSPFESRMLAVLDERVDRHAMNRRSIARVAVVAMVVLLGVEPVLLRYPHHSEHVTTNSRHHRLGHGEDGRSRYGGVNRIPAPLHHREPRRARERLTRGYYAVWCIHHRATGEREGTLCWRDGRSSET